MCVCVCVCVGSVVYWSRVLETLCGLVQFRVAIVQEKGEERVN